MRPTVAMRLLTLIDQGPLPNSISHIASYVASQVRPALLSEVEIASLTMGIREVELLEVLRQPGTVELAAAQIRHHVSPRRRQWALRRAASG